jgi:histidinol phosphatase-like enzyme (inositol monophosphatase family)
VQSAELARLAALAETAADAARAEILPRFRRVAAERKSDGSPVTEADRAAERAIRAVLRDGDPGAAILGEEYGAEGADAPQEHAAARRWLVDPIDGTIGFARGIPLFSTLIALCVGDEPVVGLIDLPGVDERYVGWRGGGVRCNGAPVRVSQHGDLASALVSHGDPMCFERFGRHDAFVRMAREIPMLRGYTDGFGHALVLRGAVDAMVDVSLNPWDAAATQVLVPEAGGRCVTLPGVPKIGLVFGSPALVTQLAPWLA